MRPTTRLDRGTPLTADESNPRTGMLAKVRHRRGVSTAVEPYDHGVAGRIQLLTTLRLVACDSPWISQVTHGGS